ncbi:hypothetical protein [Falsiphaeobacter marinintestinus]|uniref:hypothetical protein n=1 Tax=Falsiphaeobacter marinintestinus TaxID=1492905 RepID=UPI0016474308|nr:hypothetical protein [Phaeobacter marinintestinus]
MDVTLHIGAHRCATTTFQHYLRMNGERLTTTGLGFWGPRRTRAGLFSGLTPGPRAATGRNPQRRATGRVQMNLARSAQAGVPRLIVTDENMMGSVRENLRLCDLYCGVGERVARFAAAFDGYLSSVTLNIRSLEMYWASALAYSVTRRAGLPNRLAIARIVSRARSWRDVITDVACAAPGVRLQVLPFETFAGRPEAQLFAMTGQPGPKEHAREWLNAAPRLPEMRAWLGDTSDLPMGDGRWLPFDRSEAATLREAYEDDLMWLTAGADGLAQLATDPDKKQAGPTLPFQNMTRGRRYDAEQRRLAGAG